ncbi:hypothetical protein GCK32_012263 [Trichostrongylus colubriformis]|uniref:Small G protein signalling modulator 1/2 Rab-binding domain-containing protein n=1 Tax=Trichostrongylus colubriformis TaxID=6319 RepID=A0AAN8FZ11_TRICO
MATGPDCSTLTYGSLNEPIEEAASLHSSPLPLNLSGQSMLGPCAATYRRMTDYRERTAEELVRGCRPNSSSRPPLSITRRGSSIVSSTDHSSLSRDFVYSLHHNFKSSLLYGKNNVCVANGDQVPVKGYLSLHKSYEGELSLRWTPNQLMHARKEHKVSVVLAAL